MRSAPTTRPRQLSAGITGRWSSGSGRCRSADSQPQKSDPRNREVSGNGCGGCRTRADGSSHSHTGGLLTETADRLGPALCQLYNARGKRHVKNSCRLPLFIAKKLVFVLKWVIIVHICMSIIKLRWFIWVIVINQFVSILQIKRTFVRGDFTKR